MGLNRWEKNYSFDLQHNLFYFLDVMKSEKADGYSGPHNFVAFFESTLILILKKTEIRQDFTLFPHTSESFGANITLDDAGRNSDKNAT